MINSSLITQNKILCDISIYTRCGFVLTEFELEKESSMYCACTFKLGEKKIRFRTAKTTPTKSGQFVTVWKRSSQGPIIAFDKEDDIDFVIISTHKEGRSGHFIFPKSVLIAQKIISENTKGGKLGFRVYPPWGIAANSQALKTQQWQTLYFFNIIDKQMACPEAIHELLKTPAGSTQ
jgi:hypothetical protein